MNRHPRSERLERLVSRCDASAAAATLARIVTLLGVAAGLWLLGATTAHAETTSPWQASGLFGSVTGLDAVDPLPGRHLDTERGRPDAEGLGGFSTLRWMAHEELPAVPAIAPVTRFAAGETLSSFQANRLGFGIASKGFLDSSEIFSSGDSVMSLMGQIRGSSPEENLLSPLGLTQVVGGLDDRVALGETLQPVTSAALPRVSHELFTETPLVAYPAVPLLQRTVPHHETAPLAGPVRTPHAAVTSAKQAPATESLLATEQARFEAVQPVEGLPSAPSLPLPSPGGLSFPAWGTATSGGMSGPTVSPDHPNTAPVEYGALLRQPLASRISPATTDAGVPRERAQDPVVSPD